MKNLIKRALIGVLAGVMLVTSPAVARASEISETSEKGAKLRQQVEEAFNKKLDEIDKENFGEIKPTNYKGADFEYNTLIRDTVYFKIVDDSTIRLIGSDNSTGSIVIKNFESVYDLDFDKIIVDSFEGNKKLKRFVIKSEAVSLTKNCFKDCTNLFYFYVGTGDLSSGGLNNLPDGVFKNCKKLSGIAIDANKVNKIGKSAFENSGLGAITIDNAHKFKSFGESAFKNCKHLEEIYLWSNKFTKSKNVYKYYKKHTKIKIGKNAFKGAGSSVKDYTLFVVGELGASEHFYCMGNDCSDFANGKLPHNFALSYTNPDGFAEGW